LHLTLRNTCLEALSVAGVVAVSGADTSYNSDRYRRLLAQANDETKRLAFIHLLIEEKAKDRLANYRLRSRPPGLDKTAAPSQRKR
jgi:hypothetical protein